MQSITILWYITILSCINLLPHPYCSNKLLNKQPVGSFVCRHWIQMRKHTQAYMRSCWGLKWFYSHFTLFISIILHHSRRRSCSFKHKTASCVGWCFREELIFWLNCCFVRVWNYKMIWHRIGTIQYTCDFPIQYFTQYWRHFFL